MPFRHRLAGLALFGFAALSPVWADPVAFNSFVSSPPGAPIGFAYAGNKFVGSIQGDGFGVLYSTDLSGGNVQAFAPGVFFAGGSPAAEHFVSSSLGLGGFPSRDIYVAQSNNIIHITNDGTSSNVFASGLSGAFAGSRLTPWARSATTCW